jgi:hypothetical protein
MKHPTEQEIVGVKRELHIPVEVVQAAREWLTVVGEPPPVEEAVDELSYLLAKVRERTLAEAASICDRVALRAPTNRHQTDTRAAYQAGAASCAWEVRQLDVRLRTTKAG